MNILFRGMKVTVIAGTTLKPGDRVVSGRRGTLIKARTKRNTYGTALTHAKKGEKMEVAIG